MSVVPVDAEHRVETVKADIADVRWAMLRRVLDLSSQSSVVGLVVVAVPHLHKHRNDPESRVNHAGVGPLPTCGGRYQVRIQDMRLIRQRHRNSLYFHLRTITFRSKLIIPKHCTKKNLRSICAVFRSAVLSRIVGNPISTRNKDHCSRCSVTRVNL